MNERLKGLLSDLFWILLVLAIAFFFVANISCTTVKPIETPDDIETETVTTPLPCIYVIKLLEELDLPDKPPYPGHDATEEEIKSWLAGLKTTVGKREALLLGRIEAYEHKLKVHNEQEPKCIDIE